MYYQVHVAYKKVDSQKRSTVRNVQKIGVKKGYGDICLIPPMGKLYLNNNKIIKMV